MTAVSLLGVRHDENSSHLRGPADAPPAIRHELFSDAYSAWTETGFDLAGRLDDRGDLAFPIDADPWEVIADAAEAALADGPAIFLGGDHAITYPLVRGVSRRAAGLTIVHIDAHADLYEAFQGNPRSHASPFARIMEAGLASRLIQLGLRTINDHHRAQFVRFAVEVFEAAQLREPPQLALRTPVYLSVDLDALDPAFAPGVSHREPGGLSVRQVLEIIHALDQPVVAADIVEYNPRCDVAGMTATVAAKLVKEIAGVMIRPLSPNG